MVDEIQRMDLLSQKEMASLMSPKMIELMAVAWKQELQDLGDLFLQEVALLLGFLLSAELVNHLRLLLESQVLQFSQMQMAILFEMKLLKMMKQQEDEESDHKSELYPYPRDSMV